MYGEHVLQILSHFSGVEFRLSRVYSKKSAYSDKELFLLEMWN